MKQVPRAMNGDLGTNTAWQLRLFGRFSLTDRAGTLVRFPDRKTEGLLAILSLNREYGIERQVVADILWPSHSPKNLANLRQCLSVLRRVLGPNSVESSVHHCRLASSLEIVSDFEQAALRTSGGFMPGHDGDWFEGMRLEGIDGVEPLAEPPTGVDSFLQTLQWYSERDPRGMYALLSVAPAMGRSIPYHAMSLLLDDPKGKEACRGWHSYWSGSVETDLEVCIPLLRQALRISRESGDLLLASEACMELGKAYARTGRLAKALKLCDIADVVAAKSKARAPTTNAFRLRGTVLLNWHHPAAGLELFLRAEDRIEDPMELVYTQNARAFFEASLGLYERSEITHAQAMAVSRSLGHHRIGIVSALTRTILDAMGGSRSDAVTPLLGQVNDFYSRGVTQFGVYADEFLAKLYLLEGDKSAAARRMLSARKGRVIAQMAVTPLEAQRAAVAAPR